jgi:predicted dehydrogenase
VPPAVQPRIIVEAARLGKHVFCEKPLAASVDDARAARTAVDAAGVRHAIDFIFPEIASWQQVKTSVSEGAIGPPAHFAYSWRTETYATRTKARSWKNRPDEGGGVLGNFVSHVFYNIEWLLGGIREFDSVACSRDPRAGHAFDAVVRLDGGITGSVSVCTDAYPGSGHIVEIYGEDGALVLRNSTSDYVSGFEAGMATRRSGQWSRLATSGQVNPSDDGRVNAVASLVQRFVDTIHNGGSMAPNLSDGVRVQTLLARAAAAEGLAGSGAQTLP